MSEFRTTCFFGSLRRPQFPPWAFESQLSRYYNANSFRCRTFPLGNAKSTYFKVLRVRDRSCSSSFTPFILSQMPMLKELQLRDDTATGRLIIPEMMEALVRRHGNSINSVHLEASSFGKERTLDAIITTLPKLLHLSILKLWFDLNRQENEFLEALVVTLPLLRKLTDLQICFRPPKFSNPEQIWQKIMQSLSTGVTDIRSGDYRLNEEGYALDDEHSGWVRDSTSVRKDEYYGSIWPSNKMYGWLGNGRYEGCMQVRAWK